MTSFAAGAEILQPGFNASRVRDYAALLKPGVMSLVVFTAASAMVIAPGHLHPLLQLVTLACVALGAGAGGAINMWYDRDIDAAMVRTAKRPIPSGKIAPADALAFGVVLAVASVLLLGLAVGWLPAALLAGAIAFYALFYTMVLKRRTAQNIVIGGAAGALPPVIGWAAVTGDISLAPLLQFLIIFLWTPPHFWALCLYRSGDYAAVGIPMLPLTHGVTATKRQMFIYAALMVAATLAPTALGLAGALYAASAGALGAGFMWHMWRVWKHTTPSFYLRAFAYSIYYLFAVFGFWMLDALATR